MRKLVLFSIVTFSIHYLYAGSFFSGGEDGVVCFQSEEIAKNAFKSSGQIKSEYIEFVSKVYAAEYWEGAAPENKCNLGLNFKKIDTPFGLLKTDEILNFATMELGIYRPYLAKRLNEFGFDIRFDRWKGKRYINPVNDSSFSEESSGPLCKASNVPKESGCRIVQIANISGNRKDSRKYNVNFDHSLYYLMDPLNQAMVQMHERVYLLASLLGAKHSEGVRNLVRTIFEESLNAPKIFRATFSDDIIFYPRLSHSNSSLKKTYLEIVESTRSWARTNNVSSFEALNRYYSQFIRSFLHAKDFSIEKAFLLESAINGSNFDALIFAQTSRSRLSAISDSCDYISIQMSSFNLELKHHIENRDDVKLESSNKRNLIETINKRKRTKLTRTQRKICTHLDNRKGLVVGYLANICWMKVHSASYCKKNGYFH